MQLLDCIETQLISNRLPLVGVSVAAVPYANTPVVLTLHWHGFVETRLADVTDANVVAYQPVPSSALQVNDRWDRFEELEHAVLDVAWELGLVGPRAARGAALRPPRRAPRRSRSSAWAPSATLPVAIEGQPPVVAEVPDGEELIDAAGRAGYVQWLFRPVRGGVWAEVAEDVTLAGGRLSQPAVPAPGGPDAARPRRRRVVYQFGRSDGLVT